MTLSTAHVLKAMSAIAAIIAFSTPSLAQETNTPPGDPLAPEPVASEPAISDPSSAADLPPPPPAPRPKVEAWRAHIESAKPRASSTSSARVPARQNTTRRAKAAAPVAAPAVAPVAKVAARAAEVPAPTGAAPPAPMEPAPVAVPAPAGNMAAAGPAGLTENDMLPAGAAALGLLALGGAAAAMRRRKRRRDDAEFEARQRTLAMVEAEPPVLELEPAAEIPPTPSFSARPAPVHDPLPPRKAPPARFDISPQPPAAGQSDPPPPKFPDKIVREPGSEEEFMFRRDGKPMKHPAEHR